MKISNIEKTRKRLFATVCIAIGVSVIFCFTIVDILEGDTIEVFINILMIIVLIFGFLGIKKLDADMLVYRFVLIMLSAAFIYNVVIGSGNGTSIFWLFSFPLIFIFFLGKKEGSTLFAFFFIIVCVLLINPFSFNIYSYSLGMSLRFLSSLLFVALIGYGLESSRQKYGGLLIKEHTKLLEEKQNLEHALKEVKTLSGLIPICSKCKKIRDDKGYWQQVEIYVSQHSKANFSHGVCPDCFKELYPNIKYSDK